MKEIYFIHEDIHGIIGIIDSKELANLAIKKAIANAENIHW